MNLKNPETTKKIAKNLTVFAVLILSLSTIFFAQKTISAPPTQDCSAVSGTAQPGDSCLYYYPLPLCSDVPGKTWTIPTTSILTAGSIPDHRVNCADLSDLPLCSQVSDTSTAYPLKNCVNECSTISNPDSARVPANVRGVDYAIHNKDCIRFCDAVEAGVTANSGVNCVARSCHQVAYVGNPTSGNVVPNPPTNCNLLPCNLLHPNELNESKFTDANTSNYKYCDNSVKCFNFTQAQLPYLRTGSSCKIHNCRAACVNNATDDVSIILAKTTGYISDYQRLINGNYAVGSFSEPICTPKICKPIVQVPYRCSPPADQSPVIPNGACDSTGSGHTCSSGYCYATIDCNLDVNANSINCISGGGGSESGGNSDGGVDSWFYRPKPADAALNNGNLRDFEDDFEYNLKQLNDQGLGKKACFEIDFLGWMGVSGAKETIDMGYMHSSVFSDGARSPAKDQADKLGNRGIGLGYLCGMHANIYNRLTRYDTAYHKGYVGTNFTDTEATHTLETCLRFTNTFAFDHSCGERECSVTCVFVKESSLYPPGKTNDLHCSQLCGYDICRTLKVKDSDPYRCVMSGDIFTGGNGSMIGNDSDRDCMGTIDGYLRLRAVKYGEYICTFLDAKGILAYNAIYFDGSEKLADGTCISGTNNGGTCGGKNTNDDPGTADKWRTVMRIPYIESTRPISQPQGYLNKSGQLFPAQECIKTPHRITVPPLYNLANISNSQNIFTPPLYIISVSTRQGGGLSSIPADQTLGDTDFHYPEITVSFGLTTKKLSLGFGKTGYENSASADPQGIATMTSELSYSAEVFIRKEYDEVSDRPTLCLYQKIKDINGTYLNPQKISCVNRNYPDINNSANKVLLPSIDFRKLVVATDATNTYNSSRIAITYLSSSVNNAVCTSAQTSCTEAILLANTDPSVETCDSSVENHKICVKREECSKLNIECIKNEIDAHNAELANQPTDSFTTIRNQCNQILLQLCNAKFGIVSSSAATITNQNPSGAAANPKAYGWFNEICVTSGFSTKLKRVFSYKTSNGLLGKCVIDVSKKIAGDNCSDGGKSPNCPCLEYISGMSLDADQIDRNETPHEAGLCIDMPLPQLCAAINHNPVPNTNLSDQDYIQSSLNQIAYGTSTSQITNLVHISHKYRALGSSSPNIPVAGHAEFPQSIFGFDNVRGTCNGFWKKTTNISGNELPPTASCINNGGVAAWGTVTNSCVRYSCPAISTAGMDSSGNYQGGYGILETGENKGLSNGFANWNGIESTDFPVNSTSSGCITGFKTVGAVTSMSNGETNVDHAALYSRITGHSVVTLPTRKCNQLGTWQPTTNNCQRISCAAINQSSTGSITNIPSGSGDTAKWELWTNSGGASYPAVNAARSSTLVDGSIVKSAATATGTCNNNLGFFQIVGGSAPTRVCDSLGNWGPVQNACITQCDSITDYGIAFTTSNGNAYWYQAINVPISGELSTNTNGCNNPSSSPRFKGSDGSCKTTGFNGCVAGYIPYPYPALRDKYGVTYTLIDGTKPSDYNYTTTIPRNVNNDTRAAENPVRTCKSIVVVGGQANVWTNTSSTCVNSCPGADIDPRINAGKTQHNASSNVSSSVGGIVTIDWPTTTFGQWAYINSPDNITSHNGSQYFYGRTNGYYSLARKCNELTHKWDTPIAHCVTNFGPNIKAGPTTADAYAYYGPSSGRIAAGSQTGTGTCSSGTYSDTSASTTASAATCSYKDGNNRIDQTYFDTGSVAKCTPRCPSQYGNNYGSGSVDLSSSSATYYYSADHVLYLYCRSGYGSDIIGGSQTPFANCGRSPSDRSTLRPYVMCNNNGNGTASWSVVYNDCEACRGCSGNANTNNLNTYWSNYNTCRIAADRYRCTTTVSCSASCAGTMTSGQTSYCADRSSCRASGFLGGCDFNSSASCTVTCVDGVSNFTNTSCSGNC
jgi:hypothetical protein